MPSLKFLYCTKLGDAFLAEVNCCDSPLKLRINILIKDAVNRNGDKIVIHASAFEEMQLLLRSL